MRLKQVNRVLAIVAAAALLAACGKKEEAAAPGAAAPMPVVKIGHVGPVSGPIAHLGKDNELGARMAIDELNAAGVSIGGPAGQARAPGRGRRCRSITDCP